MIWLILGLLLWSLPHMFKRLAPEARARLGDRARGGVALVLLLSIVLMVIGYRMAEGPVWWGRSPATTGINNLLVLIAVYLFAASGLKTRITRSLRHPQLTAVSLWAVAHLLVNGDLPSFVLFGGLLVWALAEMALINRAEPAWVPPPPATRAKEIRAIVGTVVVYAVIAGIHTLLGYNPFG